MTLLVANAGFGGFIFGFIGILLLFVGVFLSPLLSFLKTKAGKIMQNLFIVGFLFFSLTFSYTVFIILQHANTVPEPGADAIIVLGAGLEKDQVSKILQYRLEAAAAYYRENQTSVIIVSGGQGPKEWIAESDAMKQYLIQIGIPEEKIIEENASSNTKENFVFSQQILDQLFSKPYRIVYVTNDFHLYRAGRIAEDLGFQAEGLASPSVPSLIPNLYIREYFSIIKYLLLS